MADVQKSDTGTPLPEKKIKIGLADALKAVGPHADNILIGESNHENPEVLKALYGKDSLVAYAESGVTDLYLEIHKKNQPAIDKVVSGETKDIKGFEKSLKECGMKLEDTAEDQALVEQLYTTATTASRLGISVHLADQGNGHEEMKKLMRAEVDALAEIISPEEAIEIEKKFRQARTNDTQTAEFMNNTNSGKSVAIWGAAHGSQNNDWDEKLNGTSVKLDVYANRQEYLQQMEERKKTNERLGINVGEDASEMVYLIKEGELHIADKTPEHMKVALREVGVDEPIQLASADIENRAAPAINQKSPSLGM